MRTLRQILQIRAGGNVKRFHTFQTIGEQTIAAHSWGVAALVLELHPMASRQLLAAAIMHDVAEFMTGDIPSNVKRDNPEMKAMLDDIEDRYFEALGLQFDLEDWERSILKTADLLEMLFFVMEQRNLGNRNYDIVFERVTQWLEKMPLTPRAKEILSHIKEYQGNPACLHTVYDRDQDHG